MGRASYHVCEYLEAQQGPKRCYEIWCGLAPLVLHLHLWIVYCISFTSVIREDLQWDVGLVKNSNFVGVTRSSIRSPITSGNGVGDQE